MARYLTTTLPYVNANPHIGFALEIVQADALARSWRGAGEEVFFSTGSDEHGQKIFEAAEKAGEPVQAYVDRYAGEFARLKDALDLSYDNFIRTSSPEHKAAAQEMWRRCEKDIYKKRYEGLYCVGCEAFKTARELNESGHCLLHPNLELSKLEEENYFFALSRYQQQLLDYLKRPGVVIPEWRREEAIQFVENGLEDFSISREAARLSWGVPVPGDDSQVMYVWFDALTDYISTLGWPESGNFEKFWVNGRTLQVAGKDQVRFQSLMWQAMLFSAGIKNTDQVFYHGFITSGGQKMSKSLGNVISPYELVQKYGTDATRYLLLRHVHPTEDSDVTWERLDEWYTAGLTNGLGNLVARTMQLAEKYLDAPVERPAADSLVLDVWRPLGEFKFNEVLDGIWHEIAVLDELITRERPFAVVKEDPEAGKRIIAQCVTQLYVIARCLNPFMPATSAAIKAAVLANKKPENLFPRI